MQQLLLEPEASEFVPAPSPPIAVAARNVLHVINGEHYAGAERVQDLLGLQLSNFGYRAGFACLKRGQFAASRKSVDSPLYELAMNGRFDLSPAWRLVRIVREGHYRLIHTHTARSALIGRLASQWAGVPLVHHVHSPTTCDTTHRFRNWTNCLTERIALRRAAALIAVSEAVGGYVRRQGFGAYVVANGVPARRSVPARDPAKADWTLGAIARFVPARAWNLLESLAMLRGKGLNVRLRAVGGFETREYEERIKTLAGQLNLHSIIDWTGFVRDIDGELARMDLFVLPSLFGEGLPMVVLEAMSAGLPVVASAVPGVPEAVRDGLEGLLIEPDDAEALAAAIERFVSGEVSWSELGAAARARHARCFSDVRMASDVARVYDRVLSAR